jgi:PHD/YefM family antitoxin component YafN of YafNO toxin-antitoxin module
MKHTLTISKQFTHGVELVVIPRQEYESMQRRLAEVKDALVKIRKGEKEFKNGQTRIARSLSELRK